MFNELNHCIDFYCSDDKYISSTWYEIGNQRAIEILEEFSDNDWEQLIKELPKKDLMWKQRLSYCLDGSNKYDIYILFQLLNIDDKMILENVVTALKNSTVLNETGNIDEVISKVEKILPNASPLSTVVLNDFLDNCKKTK